ncbi:2-5A-dependent ribonuclease-like isoform X2 [Notolabrus celidotus]|uniref:2-5A-dependent ribonuclease-like isoform X2 n=1 Tax=Notolabrus celidotus TaxID=1203425 RepID=UPI0014904A1C|nr:2-5A-dependent ribonuclease-like isoform X2 [Notolabrus celidotus]
MDPAIHKLTQLPFDHTVLETHPVIQCIIDNNLNELKSLLNDNNVNEVYPCVKCNDYISPLIAAVISHNKSIFIFLLEKGANPDDVSRGGLTALHYVPLSEAPPLFVEKLLEAKANLSGWNQQPLTPLLIAAINNRDDVFKLLISAGALTSSPITDPDCISHDEQISQKIRNLSLKGDELCSKVSCFLDVVRALNKKQPDEVFQTFSHMLQEHPQTHLTMIETLFNVTGPDAEEYQQRSITWLKDNGNVDSYIAGVISRFPNISQECLNQLIVTIHAVLCPGKQVQHDQACDLILLQLEQLGSEKRPDVCEFILQTLYVITQKTKDKNEFDPAFIEKMCRTIVTAAEQFNVNTTAKSTQRRWVKVSEKWREKLQEIFSTDESKVTRVGSMIYVKNEKFRIEQGSEGTEVFLGLRDDGTEVAVKRMNKCNYQVLKNEEVFLRLPELDHQAIVRYVDFAEDEDFGYLGLQLCEYTLEECITTNKDGGPQEKNLVRQVLESLNVLHQDPPILHRDLKPSNVLIDATGRAKLADFGISRRMPKGQTTYRTGPAGTKCWKAKETIIAKADVPYKSNTDIQVAGMLIYYILSGGHHPFGDEDYDCEYNIVKGIYNLDHVQDVVAKDLIEWMINEEPRQRPKVEECLSHPFFWGQQKRVRYLKEIGNLDKVTDKQLESWLEKCATDGSFNGWKNQFPPELVQIMEKRRRYADNILDLLRFIRNAIVHHPKEADKLDLISMFPALFGCVYKFAESREWNSEPALKGMFRREEFPGDDMTTKAAVSSTNSEENVKSPIQETQTSTRPTEK